jgi:hypothetical protein
MANPRTPGPAAPGAIAPGNSQQRSGRQDVKGVKQTRSHEMGTVGRKPKTMDGFAVGDHVEVRPAEEILAGLDERGERDSLPFMPEMLKFCGQQFTVESIAYKTCDTVNITGLHKMENSVHLTGLRCDGAAHGGCQAGCLIFWKTEWLTRAAQTDPAGVGQSVADGAGASEGLPRHSTDDAGPRSQATVSPVSPAEAPARTACTPERLREVALGACRPDAAEGVADKPLYSCQTTELPRATGAVIPRWDVRQYVADVRYGNAPLGRVFRGIVIEIFNLAQAVSRRVLPAWLRIKDGVKYPFIVGTARQMPVATLGLEAGDWVKVKSAEEIAKTLDKDYRNRGLYFDREMMKYCGRTAQVLRPVDRIIEETTGRMITMKTPCVILTDAVCTSDFHRSCPRAIYAYWREIWLERVPAPVPSREVMSAERAQ